VVLKPEMHHQRSSDLLVEKCQHCWTKYGQRDR